MNGTVKGLWKHYYGLVRGAMKDGHLGGGYRKLLDSETHRDNIKWLCKHYGVEYWDMVFCAYNACWDKGRG